MTYRLGVDVRRTSTDFPITKRRYGRDQNREVPSCQLIHWSTKQVANCDSSSCTDPADIKLVMHGTTVATNAVLTGRGAKVGLIHISTGIPSRGSLILSRWTRRLGHLRKKALAGTTGAHYQGKGDESLQTERLSPLSMGPRCGESLKTGMADDIEALTICFINAYINGEQERRAREIAQEFFPNIPNPISSEVAPEMQGIQAHRKDRREQLRSPREGSRGM